MADARYDITAPTWPERRDAREELDREEKAKNIPGKRLSQFDLGLFQVRLAIFVIRILAKSPMPEITESRELNRRRIRVLTFIRPQSTTALPHKEG